MSDEIEVYEFSEFKNCYKKVRNKYKHSFDKDFENVMKVITKGLDFYASYDKLPQTFKISGLGGAIKLPAYKTRIHVCEAKDKVGRVVYFFDESNKKLFLVETYYKSHQQNHDEARIKRAYDEYVLLVEQELKKENASGKKDCDTSEKADYKKE